MSVSAPRSIHSNFLPGKQNTMPPLCAINDDPADPVSYRSVDSPCSALVSFQLAYDVEQMRAALWEDVCVVSHEEHAVLCGTHQANLSANAKPWPICSAPGGQYLRSILFHSPVARSEIHQHIRTRVAGTLRLCIAGDCPASFGRLRFQWLFIGRLPTSADWGQQIKRVGVWVDVVPQRELGVLLRERADLFFSPSWHECFSNSEVQALASGLPVVALNDSSHPEVVGTGGVLFSAGSSGRGSAAAAAHAIEYAAAHLEDMRRQIPQHSIDHVANEYIKLVTS